MSKNTNKTQKNNHNVSPHVNKRAKTTPRGGGERRSSSMAILPSAYGVRTGTNLQKGIRLKKREFITNVGHNAMGSKGHVMFRQITSSSNGLLTSLAELGANVGLTSTFPWLSNVAKFFDKFIFHQCKFEYVPSTGSTTPGTVALCPTYKADESTEGATKIDLLDRAGSSRSAAWQSNSCSLDPKKANAALKSHFVRTGDVPDKKVTDPARLDVLIETPSTNTEGDLGELWVDYDVSLEVPKGITDDRVGSFAKFTLQGGSGSPKVLTYLVKPMVSSVLDFDKAWSTPDPLGDFFFQHIPFKKRVRAMISMLFPVGSIGISGDTKEMSLLTSEGTSSWEVCVDCGASLGIASPELLREGLVFKVPMAISTAYTFTVSCAEVGEQLYAELPWSRQGTSKAPPNGEMKTNPEWNGGKNITTPSNLDPRSRPC